MSLTPALNDGRRTPAQWQGSAVDILRRHFPNELARYERISDTPPMDFICGALDACFSRDPAQNKSEITSHFVSYGLRELVPMVHAVLDGAFDSRRSPLPDEFFRAVGRELAESFVRFNHGYGRGFLQNPAGLEDAPFVELASGKAFALNFWKLDPRTRYIPVDTSSLVTSYTQRVAERLGIKNVLPLEADVRDVDFAPASLGTLRSKNVFYYVPNFFEQHERMLGWIADGGQLLIQAEANPRLVGTMLQNYAPIISELVSRRGWGLGVCDPGEGGESPDTWYPTTIALLKPGGSGAEYRGAQPRLEEFLGGLKKRFGLS